ncbi:type II secretion system protein GspM [Candidatus Thiodiazotropha sp. CDECU1]|uniref:type II secretion system protein GspM n=1 Tax=Candidatus Thiodiazotropha sp. CDECU1 TaxID=3065865 RepID=UPI002930C58B|nr:type II secretion system protein GspM [Candidatus Thiodiazotropha sp. CDECU1]
MFTSLTPRQSRISAIAILILLVMAVLILAIYPIWTMNTAYNAQIEDARFQILRYQRIAKQDARYQQEFSKLKRSQQSDLRYLQSKTDSLANAELQRRIKQVAAAGGGEIISTQTVQISQEEMLNRVAIRVRMKSTLENLTKILHQLETQKPYLFVENISLRSRHLPRRRLPKTKDIQKAIRSLDLEFLLVGYIKSDGI